MSSINELMHNVKSSRKRIGVVYCSGSFNPIIEQFQEQIPEIQIFDCTKLYQGSLTFSAANLLNQIEDETKNKPAIITNLETFIIPNSLNFVDQLASLLVIREPLKPLYYLFYSKKVYRQFRDQFDVSELNRRNAIEL